MWRRFFCTIALCMCVSNGAKILGIVSSPSYSHQIAFRELWRQLSLRGHNVTLLTTDPVNDPKLTNLTEVDLRSSYDVLVDIYKELDNLNVFSILEKAVETMNSISHHQLSHPQVQKLIHNRTDQFDVVLVEVLFSEFLAFGEIYDCPKILISSLDAPSYLHQSMGNPTHPVANPEYILPIHGTLSFKERVISTLYSLYMVYFRAYRSGAEKDKIIQQYFENTSIPPLSQMASDVDMLFLNLNPVLHDVRPHSPATVYFGGGNHLTPLKPLPKDLKDFLDDAKEGAIYLSLGSNVKSETLKQEKLTVILETLSELPYKILWKYETDFLLNKSDNVKLIEWTPQQDVLRHPNIKLFITQGGLQSIEEAILYHVPLVVLPFFGDQEGNARRVDHKGIGRSVSHKPRLIKQEFKSVIFEVINNPKYKDNIKRIAKLALDQPMPGVEKAVWWTEYVIRNKGAKHLRNPATDLPLYQYFLVDVISFLTGIVVIFAVVVTLLTKASIKLVKAYLHLHMKAIERFKKMQ